MKLKLTFERQEDADLFQKVTGEKNLDAVNIGLVHIALKAQGLKTCEAYGEPAMFHVRHVDGTWTTELVSDPVEQIKSGTYLESAETPVKMLSTDSVASTDGFHWAQNRIANRYNPMIEKPYFAVFEPQRRVEVIIMDSGINAEHEELAGVQIEDLWVLPGLADGTDDLGHGTAIASLVAGNDLGVNSKAVIKNVRISGGGMKPTLTQLGEAFDAIAAYHATCPQIPKVVNMSWRVPASQFINEKLKQLAHAGILLVAAGGNSDMNIDDISPAGCSAVFTVAASSKDDRELFAVYGINKKIDLYAPGQDVNVAKWTGPTEYMLATGSSFSAGFVSGVASIIFGLKNTFIPVDEVKNLLRLDATVNALIVNDNVSLDENRLLHRPDTNSLPVDDVQFLGAFGLHEYDLLGTDIRVLFPVGMLQQINEGNVTLSMKYLDDDVAQIMAPSTVSPEGLVTVNFIDGWDLEDGEIVRQLRFSVMCVSPGMTFETPQIYFFIVSQNATAMDIKPYLDELAASSSFTFLEEADQDSWISKFPKASL